MSEAFDRLAMMLAGGGSRRDALKCLGGLLAGGFLLGLTGTARAKDKDDDDKDDDKDDNDEAIDKACGRFCKSCPKRPKGVHKQCIKACKAFLKTNPKGTLCGTCTKAAPFTGCKAGATCCAGACTDVTTDVNNCGACAGAPGAKVCTGTTPNCCAGTCTNTKTDVKNCGTCGKVCPPPTPGATPTCTNGVCG